MTTPDVVALITEGGLPKGDALAVARVAGIMAAKQTSSLIPLCHPLPLSKVTVDFETGDEVGEGGSRVRVIAVVRTTALTGVEMEALTSASVAALTLYDMVKAVDKRAVITDIRVVSKTGGKSGDWTA
jgi:cyclic pyranopterin phosphate synthase